MYSSMRSALSAIEGDRDVSLVDLDKGLRSTKKGEQIEAVVSFPTLFDKNPFPIMVNSGCLKLADAFDAGDNFTRASILTVLEQSKRHLDKILNVDEFLLRIHKVVHSNDPVARAVTLRTLGACAGILKDKADVHHSVVNALDSHDQIEVEAAIDAAVKFAEQSPNFIMNALPKIASKIQTASVPMKIRFIPILQYVYSNEDATMKVRKLCTDLLSTHPGLDVVLPVLSTLTRLSARALFDMPTQVELLLDVLQRDARRGVRAASLHHLASLVRLAPHAVTGRHAQVLLSFTVTTSDDALRSAALSILCTLAGTCAAAVFTDLAGVSRLQDFLFHPNARVSAKATELLCELITQKFLGNGKDSANDLAANRDTDLCCIDDLAYAVESLVILAGAENRRPILKVALRSAALLSRIVAIDCLMETCIEVMQFMSDDLKVLTCLFLYQMLPKGQSLVNQYMHFLISESTVVGAGKESRDRLVVALWTVLLKASSTDATASRGTASPADETVADDMCMLLAHTGALPPPPVLPALVGSAFDGWTTYRIARQAMRHGHLSVAAQLLLHLLPQVSSEVNGFYLTSLWALCRACPEASQDPDCPVTVQPRDTGCTGYSSLLDNLSRRIRWCEKAYVSARALSSHSASVAASPTSSFYQAYVALYMELLQAHNQLQMVCCSFAAYPPPATAAVPSEQSRAAGTMAHIAPQLKKCEAEFETLADKYRKLRQTMFDADQESLSHIRWLQDCCLLLTKCLDAALRRSAAAGAAAGADSRTARSTYGGVTASPLTLAAEQDELRSLWETFASTLQNGDASSSSFSTGDVIQAVQTVSMKIVNVPLRVPRYVFQRLQHTHLSINIQPAQKATNEPLLVQADSQLVLKVEGVVSCRTKLCKPLRRVAEMRVAVLSRIVNQAASSTSASHADLYSAPKGIDHATENSMVQTAAVLNDYFSVQFLLSFSVVGTHSVDIVCATIDDNGIDWIIGTSAIGSEATSVSVKSYRDQTKLAQASLKTPTS